MSLEAGARLGPYEILAPIGLGGMGEVYKARDTRLDRFVAVKILPAHLAESAERKKRFEREAKAISQLNHPHICTLHDVRLRQGYGGRVGDAGDIDYMVLEYIEGETLAERLKKGALPFDRALEYAIQMTDGLDRAHRAGIVHRDLKPGNVMITKSGVKILDFGLARLATDDVVSDDSDSPTRQKELTQERAFLGTLQYMAPEQLEGKPADARSDHWAFGCVLYETLTGRKAFEGGSQASLISAIMTSEAPVVSSLKPVAPPALDRVVRTCLAKDPDDRWHSAGDLKRELAWLAAGEDPTSKPASSSAKSRLGWAVAVLLGVALVAVGLRSSTDPDTSPATPVRFVIDLPPGQLLAGLNVPGARSSFSRYEGRATMSPLALSRDGTKLVYEAESDSVETYLYLRNFSDLTATRLSETAGAKSPFFSPDGTWLGFYAEGRLWKLSMSRHTRTAVCNVDPLMGITWLPDDTIVFGDGAGRLMRVSANGGDPEVLTQPQSDRGELRHLAPHGLPDGRALLFTVETESGAFVTALDLSSGEWTHLIEGLWPQYIPSGFIVFSSDHSGRTGGGTQTADLLAVRFDSRHMRTIGDPFRVLDAVYTQAPGAWEGSNVAPPFAAVADSGTVVYVPPRALTTASRVVWVERDGTISLAIDTLGPFEYPRLSPDGTSLAFALHNLETTGAHEVWTLDLDRGTRRLVQGDGVATRPFWTPDGSGVTYSNAAGAIHVQPLDGNDIRALVSRDGGLATAWHPSRERLFTVRSSSKGLDIWTIDADGELEPVLVTDADEHSVRPSPDGRWIAYASNESGKDEVYLRPYPGPGRTMTVSSAGGTDPVWSPAGNELFYRNGNDLMVVPIQTSPHAILGRPQKLFDLQLLGAAGPTNPAYDVTRDGQRFIMVQPAEGERTKLVHVILNWDEELERLVASDE